MKKSLSQAIALATLLGAATTVFAGAEQPYETIDNLNPDLLNVNPDGLGAALVFPLYTVENNNSTLFSVTNTTDDYKAVKVRFMEGLNSAEVLDFHLYLSPQDVWNGSVVADGAGARLISRDTSCVVGIPPATSGGGLTIDLPFRLNEVLKDEDDEKFQHMERVRIGHVEVIEMGTFLTRAEMEAVVGIDADGNPTTAYSNTEIATIETLKAAIKHTAGVPADCAAINAAWEPEGLWYESLGAARVNSILAMPNGVDAVESTSQNLLAGVSGVTAFDTKFGDTHFTDGLKNPQGGLYGTAAIVNVAESTGVTYDATALNGVYASVQHTYPGTIFPHLLTGVEQEIGSNGYGILFGLASNIGNNSVSTLLTKSAVFNDYFVNPAFGAQTDFVMTFPTKRFHVNLKTASGAPQVLLEGFPSLLPFTRPWDKGKSCDRIGITYYDKEEARITVGVDKISPMPDNGASLCYEVNILGFNDSNILGADLDSALRNVRSNFELDPAYMEGWAEINLVNPTVPVFGPIHEGLPVVGFSAITTKNGVQNGVVKNFGQSFNHKYEVAP